MFDFVGQDNSSTEIFSIREATGVQIDSNTLSGSIEDHNIMGFSTLYILWTASPEEEVKHLFIIFVGSVSLIRQNVTAI